MENQLQHQLKNIPHQPGVYKMKNSQNEIIYIGKAKDLYKRVNSYFQNTHKHPPRTAKLVENIKDLEYIVASSELEALILETNLIKENRPKYNILMKDDKNFAYIKITTNEDYPRILVVRKVLKDKAKYFGPKTAASRIYDTLTILRKIFPYRNCNLEIKDLGPAPSNDVNNKRAVSITKASIKYPCLDLHIKRCVAPCVGKPSQEDYQNIINQIINFLEGKYQHIVDQLKLDMQQAAINKRFEQAAKIRDKILAIENIYQNQLVSNPDHQNADIINFFLEDDQAFFNLFQIREGKLIDQQNLTLKRPIHIADSKLENQEILTTFLQQFYADNTNLPKEIIIPEPIENQDLIEKWLSQDLNYKLKINIPQKGKKDKLLELSLENAISYAKQSRARWEGESKTNRQEALEKLAQILGLPKIPKRLECYDISHLSGTHTVASMSVFENGFPKKDQYRHFKISLEKPGQPDDFASMEEVILRRLKYLKPSIATKGIVITKNKIAKSKKQSKAKSSVDEVANHTQKQATTFISETIVEYFTVKLNKQKVAELSLHPNSNKLKTFITNFTKPTENYEAITKKIIEKFTCKRLYLICTKADLRSFETLGFQELQSELAELQPNSKETVIVYDKTRNFEDPSFKKIPDLIVIDGGKGQLSHAVKAMEDHQLVIPIISLAKKQEEFFLPNQSQSIKLEASDQSRLMIQHLRDEAHRFAIEYNRKLRKNDYTSSQLEEIQGIGKKLTQKLLRHFGSVESLRNQSEAEIAKLVGNKIAIKIKSQLN